MPDVFISYSHRDEKLVRQLRSHLAPLERSGRVVCWYDRELTPGRAFDEEIASHLQKSHIVLLGISADFLNSDYCNLGMEVALKMHRSGQVIVIPVTDYQTLN